ncbi:MAG: homocysteine S-methyltransferase family protein [Alphaproteobacteria bacterium]
MPKYRDHLPQMEGGFFLTDGGMETTLVFHDGIDLPHFAAFDLLRNTEGRQRLRDYYDLYAGMAVKDGHGFILETPTWRASSDWGTLLGYSTEELANANRDGTALMEEVRRAFETPFTPMVISGCIGPRGDGYDPGDVMTVVEARAYHAEQIGTFAKTEADMVTAITMTNVPEAIGLIQAAQAAQMPAAISFTVETDGRLPTGESLKSAIEAVDDATGNGPAYYMINCAHPDHFSDALAKGEAWVMRLQGLRGNASRMSHEELDNAEELDAGDPHEFGALKRGLVEKFAHINVVGGCCGTDHRHVGAFCSGHRKAA